MSFLIFPEDIYNDVMGYFGYSYTLTTSLHYSDVIIEKLYGLRFNDVTNNYLNR
ncbi:hypothetical protein [Pseudoalteromonas sp. SK18]|uniref:hypothetical protein n=1 Tax=Pseudoalteromonas sp. SK18 TaxID=1938366 RepID=UPI00158A4B53|nr:hypothetical protein [Pseudoalteromonas sp. SK18]